MLLARRMRAQWLLAACVGLGIALVRRGGSGGGELVGGGGDFPLPRIFQVV